jgi:hypothetical protein
MTALPANGKTYRLVTDSNGTVEASSVHVSAADAVDMLAAEVLIHRLAGWRVEVYPTQEQIALDMERYGHIAGWRVHQLICERGESRRVVTVEEV